jgi:sugar phosphate isomerase/epimerase
MCLETLLGDPAVCDLGQFERIARATSEAGFTSVAVWAWRLEQMGLGAARRILDEVGLRVRLAECRIRWAEGPEAAVDGLEAQLDTLESLGASMVLAISKETSLDLARASEGFAALCERAAPRGLRVTIEFIPCRGLSDLATAWTVVRRSGAANGGLDLDMMHWQNQAGGPDLGLLRRIPGRHLHYVQVCDATRPGPPLDDYIAAAVSARPLPGDGVVDVRGILNALGSIGADPFFSMEVFNSELLATGPESMALRLRAAAESAFA